MVGRLRELAGGSPGLPAGLVGLGLLIAWAAAEGGYPVTHWAAGGILLVALIAAGAALGAARSLEGFARIGVLCLFAYAAWSFLSILWAKEPGAAFEGGDRALLYALYFALFCWFALRPRAAALLLVAFLLALGGLALAVFCELASMGRGALAGAFPGGRLVYPAGYVNAAPAQWTMAALPATLLVKERRLGAPVRGLLGGVAVLLLALSYLSLSRGWLVALAITAVLMVVTLPGRLASFWSAFAVGAGFAVDLPFLLKVSDRAEAGLAFHHQLEIALAATVASAALVGAAVAAFAVLQRRRPSLAGGRPRRFALGGALALVLAGVGLGLAAVGNPISKVEHAWNTFTSPKGYEANSRDTNRLLAGFGSNRYDFYRVAFHQFLDHPLTGDGSENFLYAYLREGRSGETPRYPHSLELRALSETGVVGALIGLVGLVAALLAAGRAIAARGLSGSVAAAALAGFVYWLIQGSFDWFWEYAVLGGMAFSLLGVAVGLAGEGEPRRLARQRLVRLMLPVAGLAAAAGFALPWLSGLAIEAAAKSYPQDLKVAYSRLELAAALDPLSAQPALLAGTIAARSGELRRAERRFSEALSLYPEELYATLELAGIAAERGQVQRAERLLQRAHRLDRVGELPLVALRSLEEGRILTVTEIEKAIRQRASSFE